jgi:hypothetical protein
MQVNRFCHCTDAYSHPGALFELIPRYEWVCGICLVAVSRTIPVFPLIVDVFGIDEYSARRPELIDQEAEE